MRRVAIATAAAIALPGAGDAAPMAIGASGTTGAPHAIVTVSASAGRMWSVDTGDDLRSVLDRWTRSAGWTLIWNTDFSWTVAGRAAFPGDVVAAVGALVTGMQEARPAPVVDVYRANRVMVVHDGLSAAR